MVETVGSVSERNLDEKVVEFLEGIPPHSRKATAEKLVAALKHFFSREAEDIPTTYRFLKQIKRACLSNTKPPMIFEVMTMVAGELIQMGYPTTALALYLQFDCYLRPAEVCGIQAGHILYSGGSVLGELPPRAIVILPNTKTGPLQSVDIRVPILQIMLKRLTDLCSPHQLLFPNYQCYSLRLKWALKTLGLSFIGYTPHSIRHGSATTDLLRFGYGHLPAIMFRGRWESNAGKKVYSNGCSPFIRRRTPGPSYRDCQNGEEITTKHVSRLLVGSGSMKSTKS